ncbi:MAG: M14 family zinc carboxypeptidase [Armatimonadota bacterium]
MRLDKLILLIAVIILIAVYFCPVHHTVTVNALPNFDRTLAAYNQSRYARVFSIGKSAGGKKILAVSLVAPSKAGRLSEMTRILVISGQHVNEQMPIRAALRTIETLANVKNLRKQQLLSKTAIIIIPIANPDALQPYFLDRYNANGIDTNRDWNSLSQPETRAILYFARKFKPHIFVDCHEGQPNKVEIPSYGSAYVRGLTMRLASIAASTTPDPQLRLIPGNNSPGLSRELAHRKLASLGVCGMLLESPMDIPWQKRQTVYERFLSKLFDIAAFPLDASVRRGLTRLKRETGIPNLDLVGMYTTTR